MAKKKWTLPMWAVDRENSRGEMTPLTVIVRRRWARDAAELLLEPGERLAEESYESDAPPGGDIWEVYPDDGREDPRDGDPYADTIIVSPVK